MGDELISKLTEIVREADDRFAQVGGSTRHWVRDCFLPLVEQGGLEIIDAKQRSEYIRMVVLAGRNIGKCLAQKEIERLTLERDEARRWARHCRAMGTR